MFFSYALPERCQSVQNELVAFYFLYLDCETSLNILDFLRYAQIDFK